MTLRLTISFAIFTSLLIGCSKPSAPPDSSSAPAARSRAVVYDESLDGEAQIADAAKVATRDGKNILLQFGGEWCGPCLELHDLFQTNKHLADFLQANFVYVSVCYNDKNRHLGEEYRAINMGVPFIVVLDPQGKHAATINAEDFDEHGRHIPEKLLTVLHEWTPMAYAAKRAAIASKSTAQWVQEFVSKPDTADTEVEIAYFRKHPAEAVAALTDVIRSQSNDKGATMDQAVQAYSALEELGPHAKPAIPFLIEQFTTSNELVHFAADTLPKLGPEAKTAIPTLVAILNNPELIAVSRESAERADPPSWLVYSTANCLSQLDPTNPKLLESMVAWLQGQNLFCKRVAPAVLGELGPAAKSAIPALTKAVDDKDTTVQRNATEAIAKINGRAGAASDK